MGETTVRHVNSTNSGVFDRRAEPHLGTSRLIIPVAPCATRYDHRDHSGIDVSRGVPTGCTRAAGLQRYSGCAIDDRAPNVVYWRDGNSRNDRRGLRSALALIAKRFGISPVIQFASRSLRA